jgi:hypothetical protein
MRAMDGWFLLSQPKYRVPGVFDLHSRGLFREQPSVTHQYGARMLVNEDLRVALEYRFLKPDNTVHEGTFYTFATRQGILILDEKLSLDLIAVNAEVADADAWKEIKGVYEQWCRDYIPTDGQGGVDIPALERKLQASIGDAKKQLREELKRKNGTWVASRAPAQAGRFFRWQEGQMAEDLFEVYTVQGGEDTEAGLIKKAAQLITIYDTTEPDGLVRADGESWHSEDEMWECWVGFAGSEDEARRVFRSLDIILKPQAV